MKKTLFVKCPMCGGTLEVNAENGKVVQHWVQGPPGQADDLMSKLDVVKERQRRLAETDAAALARKLEEQKKKGAAAFDAKVKEAKKAIDAGERPENPMDLD